MKWSAMLLIAVFFLSACTRPEDVYHLEATSLGERRDGSESTPGVAVDAKQRFIWGPIVPIRQLKETDGSQGTEVYEVKNRQVICAEPSPDALSTFSASVAAALRGEVYEQSSVSGEVSQSLSETARILGERTPTIQLLRDGFYRACEAYGNGVIDSFGYALILNKIDNVMVQLLAIDALGRGQLTQSDVTKIEQSAQAEEAAEVARATLQEAEQASSTAATLVENLRAQQRALAGRISAFEAEEAQAKAAATAAARAEEQLSAARTASTDLAVSIAAKEAEKESKDKIANDAGKTEAERQTALADSQRLAGELGGLRVQQRTADTNLRNLEAAAARGGPANEDAAELAARLGALKAQKAALDSDVTGAESAETAARTAETSARSTFASAQASAEGKRAVLGTIRPELSSAAMLQIGKIAQESHSSDGGLSTITGACALWFAQHPSVKSRVAANGQMLLSTGEVPAIAHYCDNILRVIGSNAVDAE